VQTRKINLENAIRGVIHSLVHSFRFSTRADCEHVHADLHFFHALLKK
jgi:hypothetical protein